jgi:hypothetical protein
MNPSVPQSVIDEAYERDPGNAAAEYGAEFRRDVETLISREAVDACVVLTPDQSRIFLQELPKLKPELKALIFSRAPSDMNAYGYWLKIHDLLTRSAFRLTSEISFRVDLKKMGS